MTGEKPALQKAALLLGEKVKKESTDIYFISAAVAVVTDGVGKRNRFKLSSDEWTALYEQNQFIILKTGIYWVVFVETGAGCSCGRRNRKNTQ